MGRHTEICGPCSPLPCTGPIKQCSKKDCPKPPCSEQSFKHACPSSAWLMQARHVCLFPYVVPVFPAQKTASSRRTRCRRRCEKAEKAHFTPPFLYSDRPANGASARPSARAPRRCRTPLPDQKVSPFSFACFAKRKNVYGSVNSMLYSLPSSRISRMMAS